MNSLSQLAVGAPAQGGMPQLGAWGHFIWVLVILALIIFVLWWAWGKISPSVPEPLRTILFVLGIVAVALMVIFWILVPLMSVF